MVVWPASVAVRRRAYNELRTFCLHGAVYYLLRGLRRLFPEGLLIRALTQTCSSNALDG